MRMRTGLTIRRPQRTTTTTSKLPVSTAAMTWGDQQNHLCCWMSATCLRRRHLMTDMVDRHGLMQTCYLGCHRWRCSLSTAHSHSSSHCFSRRCKRNLSALRTRSPPFPSITQLAHTPLQDHSHCHHLSIQRSIRCQAALTAFINHHLALYLP